MQENLGGTYFGYESYLARELEKKALKRTALSIGLSIVVYFASSFLVGNLLVTPVSYLLSLAKTVEVYDIIYESYVGLSYLIPLVLAIIPIALLTKIPARVAIPVRKTNAGVSAAAVMAGLGSSVVGIVIASVFLSIVGIFGTSYSVPAPVIPETTVGVIMYLVIISVFPALLEEILFRGFILQSLRRFGDMFAIIISALIFALYHGNFMQFPNAFVMGFVLAFIAVRTGSLVTGMVLHFINNFVITLLDIFLLSSLDDITAGLVTVLYLGVYFLIGIIGAVILVVKYPKFFTLKKSDSPLTAAERTKAFFLQPVSLAGMLLMIGLCFTFFAL